MTSYFIEVTVMCVFNESESREVGRGGAKTTGTKLKGKNSRRCTVGGFGLWAD